MKTYIDKVLVGVLLLLFATACEKDELGGFTADSAINFTETTSTYTFLGNPDDEYIAAIPVQIIGDTLDRERNFAVEIVQDSLSTASSDLYEILEPVIAPGEFTGNLYIKIFKKEVLNTTEASLHLRLVDSPDFKQGNTESIDYTFKWTNKVVVPSWSYFRYFFCATGSTTAYLAIVESTGLTSFTAADFREIGQTGGEALGRKFGDYVKQYNLEHPDEPLVHDDGAAAGEEIVPLYYTHSIYD